MGEEDIDDDPVVSQSVDYRDFILEIGLVVFGVFSTTLLIGILLVENMLRKELIYLLHPVD